MERLQILKKQWFILGLLAVIALALLFPGISVLNSGKKITNIFTVLLFLNMGFTLPSEVIKKGLLQFKLHLYLQGFIFLAVPLYFAALNFIFKPILSLEIRIGFIALACLPTTISTCSVFTQSSGGNTVAALFNAALANLIGVFLSPILLSFFLKETGKGLPVSELFLIIKSLGFKMILPLAGGQILHFYLQKTAIRLKKPIAVYNNLLILGIVLFSLAKSAGDPVFFQQLRSMLIPMGLLAVSHYLLTGAAVAGAGILKLPDEDKIAVLYTAPQKTLAMGVPLLTTYFSKDPALLGTALIPLLFYHPWQLFSAGLFKGMKRVRKWGKS